MGRQGEVKIYAKRMIDNKVEDFEIQHDLGIVVSYRGRDFRIHTDNGNELCLSSGGVLRIEPIASNSVRLVTPKPEEK